MSKAAAKRKKTTAKTTAHGVALIRQPNGKGALYAGGVPGNAGNPEPTGPVPSKVRAACRKDFHAARPILKRFADGNEKDIKIECPRCKTKIPIVRAAERIRAIDTLGKYAGLEKANTIRVAAPEVKERLLRMWEWFRSTPLIADDKRAQVIQENSEIWGGRKT